MVSYLKRKPLFRSLLLLGLLICGLKGLSQTYLDIFSITYGYSPETYYEESNRETPIQNAALNLTLPFPTKSGPVILTGVNAFTNRLRLGPESTESTGLYSISLQAGVRIDYGNGWSGIHYLIPRLSSSFQAPRDGFQIATLQLFEKQKTPNSTYSVGVYLSEESYGWMLVPLLGFYYGDPSDLWEIRLFLPSRGDLNFRLTDRMRAGLYFDGLGSTHDIDNVQFGQAYVQRISNDLQAYLQFGFGKSLLFAIRGGYSFFRSYKVYDKDDTAGVSIANFFFNDPRTPLNASIQDGFLFSFKLTYRIHLEP